VALDANGPYTGKPDKPVELACSINKEAYPPGAFFSINGMLAPPVWRPMGMVRQNISGQQRVIIASNVWPP